MHPSWQDVGYGLRMLRKSSSFTVVAVLTLALGIGANTAIFSIVNGLILRPLPVKNPGEIVVVALRDKAHPFPDDLGYADYVDCRQQAGAFSDMAAAGIEGEGFTVDNRPEEALSRFVSGNFFTMMGVQPTLGRLIQPNEGQAPGSDPVTVLGYSYWQRRFNGDPHVIGKVAMWDGHPVTVIGVVPRQFK